MQKNYSAKFSHPSVDFEKFSVLNCLMLSKIKFPSFFRYGKKQTFLLFNLRFFSGILGLCATRIIVLLGNWNPPSNRRAALHKPSNKRAALHKPSNRRASYKPSNKRASLHKPSNKRASLHKPSNKRASLHKPSNKRASLHKPSNRRASLH